MLFFLFITSSNGMKLEKRAGIKPTTFSLWSRSIFMSYARITRSFLGALLRNKLEQFQPDPGTHSYLQATQSTQLAH